MKQRIIGIDPGSRVTGYGIIECESNNYRYIRCGTISIKGETFPARLKHIFDSLTDVLNTYPVDAAAVESVFMHTNPSSAIKLGQARGAALCAIMNQSVDVGEYAPREVKQAVVGYGGATKVQVQQMVKTLLNLIEIPPTDAADGLAVAICHAAHLHSRERLGAAAGANPLLDQTKNQRSRRRGGYRFTLKDVIKLQDRE